MPGDGAKRGDAAGDESVEKEEDGIWAGARWNRVDEVDDGAVSRRDSGGEVSMRKDGGGGCERFGEGGRGYKEALLAIFGRPLSLTSGVVTSISFESSAS